jgi:hypothetical protein
MHWSRCGFAALVMVVGCRVVSPPPAAPPPAVEPKVAVAVEAPRSPPTETPKAAAKPEATKAGSPKPATSQAAKSAPPTPPAPVAAKAPVLDLRTLEQRLKDTNAIGVMTKLSLKNQVDDLVAQFRAFHDGRRPPYAHGAPAPLRIAVDEGALLAAGSRSRAGEPDQRIARGDLGPAFGSRQPRSLLVRKAMNRIAITLSTLAALTPLPRMTRSSARTWPR